MKIDSMQNATRFLAQSAANREKPPIDFQAVLNVSQQGGTPSVGTTAPVTSADNKGVRKPESQMTPAEYLADYVRKSPAQHMREAILKKMGLTEEELDAMPPEQRAAVEQTITEKINEVLQGKNADMPPQGPSARSLQAFLI